MSVKPINDTPINNQSINGSNRFFLRVNPIVSFLIAILKVGLEPLFNISGLLLDTIIRTYSLIFVLLQVLQFTENRQFILGSSRPFQKIKWLWILLIWFTFRHLHCFCRLVFAVKFRKFNIWFKIFQIGKYSSYLSIIITSPVPFFFVHLFPCMMHIMFLIVRYFERNWSWFYR